MCRIEEKHVYIYIYTVNSQMDRESQGPKVHESRVATRCQGAVVPRLTRPRSGWTRWRRCSKMVAESSTNAVRWGISECTFWWENQFDTDVKLRLVWTRFWGPETEMIYKLGSFMYTFCELLYIPYTHIYIYIYILHIYIYTHMNVCMGVSQPSWESGRCPPPRLNQLKGIMKRIDSSAYQVRKRVTRHGSDSNSACESPELFIFGRWNMAEKKMADIFKRLL